jgi:hypothetical protein
VRTGREMSRPLGFDPKTVQPVATRYAEYDIPSVAGDMSEEVTEFLPHIFWPC